MSKREPLGTCKAPYRPCIDGPHPWSMMCVNWRAESPQGGARPGRCSLCGCERIPLNREKTQFGACTFIECKDPTYDYYKERGAPPATAGEPQTKTVWLPPERTLQQKQIDADQAWRYLEDKGVPNLDIERPGKDKVTLTELLSEFANGVYIGRDEGDGLDGIPAEVAEPSSVPAGTAREFARTKDVLPFMAIASELAFELMEAFAAQKVREDHDKQQHVIEQQNNALGRDMFDKMKMIKELAELRQERDALAKRLVIADRVIVNQNTCLVEADDARERAESSLKQEQDNFQRLAEKLEKSEQALGEARGALRGLVNKLKLILPKVDAMCLMESIHGRPYTGPTLTDELAAAEAALKSKEEKGERQKNS